MNPEIQTYNLSQSDEHLKSLFYNELSEIKLENLEGWLKKARDIQWDYKNLVKRKGQLERLK